MQVEDSLGHVKVMANGLVLAYSCREGVPGLFGLDSERRSDPSWYLCLQM